MGLLLIMTSKDLVIFKGKNIRRHWDEKQEKWFFSVVDIIGLLTESSIPKRYLSDLKRKLKLENSKVYEKIVQLKMISTDGKKYLTDAADVETLFRLIQSVTSPKAEPIKLWLAKVGHQRIQDMSDPERSLNRARDYWQRMGRSQKWIQQRMMGQEIRNKLTDYWKDHKVKKENEYAILTNIIHQEWSDLTVREHKNLKGLANQNLRDHMSDAELIFTALAELSTRQISEAENAVGFKENKIPAVKGGRIAKRARLDLESKTNQKVVTGRNYLKLKNKK